MKDRDRFYPFLLPLQLRPGPTLVAASQSIEQPLGLLRNRDNRSDPAYLALLPNSFTVPFYPYLPVDLA